MSAMKELLADVQSLVDASSLELVSDALDFIRTTNGAPYVNSQAAPALLAACQRWESIAQRDGLQEIRGLAWHDGDLDALRSAIAEACPVP